MSSIGGDYPRIPGTSGDSGKSAPKRKTGELIQKRIQFFQEKEKENRPTNFKSKPITPRRKEGSTDSADIYRALDELQPYITDSPYREPDTRENWHIMQLYLMGNVVFQDRSEEEIKTLYENLKMTKAFQKDLRVLLNKDLTNYWFYTPSEDGKEVRVLIKTNAFVKKYDIGNLSLETFIQLLKNIGIEALHAEDSPKRLQSQVSTIPKTEASTSFSVDLSRELRRQNTGLTPTSPPESSSGPSTSQVRKKTRRTKAVIRTESPTEVNKKKSKKSSKRRVKTKELPKHNDFTNFAIHHRRYPPLGFADTMRGAIGKTGKLEVRSTHGKGDSYTPAEIVQVHQGLQRKELGGKGGRGIFVEYTELGKAMIQQQATRGCTSAVAGMLIIDNDKQCNPMLLRGRNIGDTASMSTEIRQAGLTPLVKEMPNNSLRALQKEIHKNGPAIVGVHDPVLKGHVVVVDDISEAGVRLRDPYHGWEITVTKSAFRKRYSGGDIIQVSRSVRLDAEKPIVSSSSDMTPRAFNKLSEYGPNLQELQLLRLKSGEMFKAFDHAVTNPEDRFLISLLQDRNFIKNTKKLAQDYLSLDLLDLKKTIKDVNNLSEEFRKHIRTYVPVEDDGTTDPNKAAALFTAFLFANRDSYESLYTKFHEIAETAWDGIIESKGRKDDDAAYARSWLLIQFENAFGLIKQLAKA